jgi:hypothetical protein
MAADLTAGLEQLHAAAFGWALREVKRAHISLLINIKNTLSAEQQAKLAAARGAGAGAGAR